MLRDNERLGGERLPFKLSSSRVFAWRFRIKSEMPSFATKPAYCRLVAKIRPGVGMSNILLSIQVYQKEVALRQHKSIKR